MKIFFSPVAIIFATSWCVLLSPPIAGASDFSGDLKRTTIVNPSSANQPPVANITTSVASKTPLTIQFDASTSTDADGTIVSYHWDFGNGKTADGKTVPYAYDNDGELQITLSVVDSSGAVSLAHLTYTYHDLADAFDTDSSVNYAPLSGGITVSGGAAHGQTWKLSQVYHKTALSGPNHWVQADVSYNGLSDYGGLIARVDPVNQTGYAVYFAAGKINLGKFAGTQSTWLAQFDGKYGAGTYNVKLAVVGTTITIYVNGTQVLSKTDATYATGTNVGFRLNRGSANADVTVDNVAAVAAY